METPFVNVLSPRGQRTEDRRVRFAHARQKLPDLGNVTEVEERSPVTQEFFSGTWKLRSSMFCPQSSVFCPLKDRIPQY
ncbi:hypothetical protein BES34_016845 [Leptospira inadai serovar Lyme]|uniref:Uncharacterized protein n=1 Tax=Leptospira inadai serovar Lyme TaxID=293084 RepID=A0ABX4YF17_9LEPT|nr:hypothetical protein BES34_016845 [Leptospira inadai serovar Lyme]